MEKVAPLVGAWIEIFRLFIDSQMNLVAPLVGAWIEIFIHSCIEIVSSVAPLVGAWIEIKKTRSKTHWHWSLLL